MSLRHTLAFLLLLAPALTAPACGGASISDICERVVECEGGGADAVDDCIEEAEELQDQAEALGCGSEFDEFLACADDELTCGDDEATAEACDAEVEALNECAEGSSDDDDGAGTCGWGCSDGVCTCAEGPNSGANCCDDDGTPCEAPACDTLCCT